jgi:lysophospholipase L1-like esterase
LDDYIKTFKKDKEGLHGKFKIIGQVGLGLIVGLTLYLSPNVVIRENVEVQKGGEIVEVIHKSQDEKSTKTTIPFFKNNNFVGRGISGQVTSQMLVRFRQDVLELNPKYVVIMAGTNDIALNNGPIELKNVLDNLKSMCELAKFHKKKVILCSVPPANRFGWRKELKPADDIIKLNEMIKEYAASAKIPYVDYHSAIKDSENGLPAQYAKDGVHPNLECYKIMEEIVMKYIK